MPWHQFISAPRSRPLSSFQFSIQLKHKYTSSLCAPANPEPPITTVIKNEKNVCKITFSPNIVQQAKITTNGILGDFVVRYDVQRDMGIGDIQVTSTTICFNTQKWTDMSKGFDKENQTVCVCTQVSHPAPHTYPTTCYSFVSLASCHQLHSAAKLFCLSPKQLSITITHYHWNQSHRLLRVFKLLSFSRF